MSRGRARARVSRVGVRVRVSRVRASMGAG